MNNRSQMHESHEDAFPLDLPWGQADAEREALLAEADAQSAIPEEANTGTAPPAVELPPPPPPATHSGHRRTRDLLAQRVAEWAPIYPQELD